MNKIRFLYFRGDAELVANSDNFCNVNNNGNANNNWASNVNGVRPRFLRDLLCVSFG
nr:MAG TPA: hypothetical protein [Caudoviricetes sp.]